MTDDFRTIEGRAVRSWQEARGWAKKMNQQGSRGHSDWRVPTVKEYQQIYDSGRSRRSYKGHRLGWPSVFENGGGKFFWSSEKESSGYAWGVSFTTGGARQWGQDTPSRNLSVRLVRPQ